MDDEYFDPNLEPAAYENLWNAPGTRTYHVGVDRGMLYLESGVGVPWNGLTAVDESPSGGDIVPFYIDGVRRRNDHYLEEFTGTIEAYSSPREFAVCEGEIELAPGFFLGQQNRESFGFSYRSFIGNDLDGHERHYELNLIYNAMAQPSSKTSSSIGASVDPNTKSWNIETVPEDLGMNSQPSARLRLDTRSIDPSRLRLIEDILYGAESTPRLPDLVEVYEILTVIEPEPEAEDIPWEEPEEESEQEPIEG